MHHRIPAYSIGIRVSSAAIANFLDRAMATIRIWRERVHQRRQLQQLSDRDLRDIGISRLDAKAEYGKPFWQE
jgi:uncharacterized protein YjiS (DUF1127 family)